VTDELKESSYIFSLRNLEAIERERVVKQQTKVMAQVADSKRQFAELNARVRAAETEAEVARNRVQTAEAHEDQAIAARLAGLKDYETLRAKFQAELEYQRLEVTERAQHELALAQMRSHAALRTWRVSTATVGALLLAVSTFAASQGTSVAAQRGQLLAQLERQTAALSSTRQREEELGHALRVAQAQVAELATKPAVVVSESQPAPVSTPKSGPKRPPTAHEKRPCDGDPNDPLNPCVE
jgi:hypothetical protein